MKLPKKKVVFLFLEAHTSVGGIQRFNQNVLESLNYFDMQGLSQTCAYALKENELNFSYSHLNYKIEKNNKIRYLLKSIWLILGADIIVFGHINLIFPLGLISSILLKKKSLLFVHGIEIWNRLPFHKRFALNQIHKLLPVSQFTSLKMIENNGVHQNQIFLFPNCINEDFGQPIDAQFLNDRFQLKKEDFVILTICRIDSTEKYKGYDKIIGLFPNLLAKYPNVKYILGGKADPVESNRLTSLIKLNGLENSIFLGGFIPEEEIKAYYALCDLFIMPSKKEGFGIVFLEALAFGKPVIGGNKDGTVDALLNGNLGTLINPDDNEIIFNAILNVIEKKIEPKLLDSDYLKRNVMSNFGFNKFKKRLEDVMFNI